MFWRMTFKTIKRFKLELDEPDDAVYASGEIVSWQVVLELNRETKVYSMKVIGRGVATAHWLEDHSVGMNAVYNDYTSKITYFRKRQHLIRGNSSAFLEKSHWLFVNGFLLYLNHVKMFKRISIYWFPTHAIIQIKILISSPWMELINCMVKSMHL